MLQHSKLNIADRLCGAVTEYLMRVQDFTPGEYYGSFWSEKAYHGPLLNWHAGGSHHHRGCGSAALALWQTGKQTGNRDMLRRAEQAFDWLAARQHERGGWFEIQNNEKPSDWELTGLEELSTISTAFAVHGLGYALLDGLPPKKSYFDCLLKAGLWFISIEMPPGSGIFPHHERSPYDTLNATMHAVESLALISVAIQKIYNKKINIFQHAAYRGLEHTIPLQSPDGCMPYRAQGGITINYTSLVLWCLFNTEEVMADVNFHPWPERRAIDNMVSRACKFLRQCVANDGSLEWETHESSSAKYNMWTYFITLNVLLRAGGTENYEAADKMLGFVQNKITASGLPPMRDRGEEITECAFMQADILLFMLPFSSIMNSEA